MNKQDTGPSPTPIRDNFAIGLFEIGDVKSCLFSFCCPQCALAQSRTDLDGSACCFNCVCLPLIPYRWMARSAYGIGSPDDCLEDTVLSMFCGCCVINQLYQTTSTFQNPTTDGGAIFNTGTFAAADTTGNSCGRCICAFCCIPCSVAKVMTLSIGMPYILAFCCVNPCVARNFLRYQYRIAGNDVMEECVTPFAMYFIGSCIATCCPCVWCPIAAAFGALSMQMQLVAESRGGGINKRYLAGYSPPAAVQQVQMIQMVPTNNQVYMQQPQQVVYAQPGQYQQQPGPYPQQPGQFQQQPGQFQQQQYQQQPGQFQQQQQHMPPQEPVFYPMDASPVPTAVVVQAQVYTSAPPPPMKSEH